MPAVAINDLDFLAALDDDYPAVDFGAYLDDSFYSQVRSVGDTLRNVMQDAGEEHPLTFGFECDSEGIIDGATIGLAVPGEWSQYVVKFIEVKHLTDDREATGKESALAIKSVLMSNYLEARAFAEKKGLI